MSLTVTALRAGLLALAALLPGPGDAAQVHAEGRAASRLHARATWTRGVVKPFRFNQRLLICNAYPSESAMIVTKNAKSEKENVTDNFGIAFRACRYVDTHVRQGDRLEIGTSGDEVHGTFEVGALPSSDAVLLLVLERRSDTQLVDFQSFAFPAIAEGQDAQIAVIDAFRGNTSESARLRMEDHITGKEAQMTSKRVEQLKFNRVYAVEEGKYDASIASAVGGLETAGPAEARERKVLRLAKRHYYVILRTGDGLGFPESLSAFPEPPPERSGSERNYAWCLAWPVIAAFFAFFT